MWRALIAVLLLAGVARADGPRTTPFGFDHTVHDRDVNVSGGEPIACAHCHQEKNGRLVGRPEHAACFGACHGAPPATPARGARLAIEPARMKLCANCHAEAALVAPFTGKLAVTYPPYTTDQDFNLLLGHKQHREVACTQCHDPITKKRPPPHQRCAGCHDGGKNHGPAMATCGTCHPPAVGKPQPPELRLVLNSVRSVFSHGAHAARGGAGKDCTTCHAPIKDADETVLSLPRPTVKECARCHDGKAAFSTTGACTKCHDQAPAKFDVARPEARFSHDGHHDQVVATSPCTSCHKLDARTGEVTIAGHAACTTCHADDFELRFPAKCGACHNATEPWRHLRADRQPPDSTEFGASLDHGKHAGACTRCHTLQTRTTQLRMPRGHVACTGGGCHAATTGPAPQLAQCDGCHRLGRAAARLANRAADPWSVRLAFDHAPHAKASDGSPLACTACHVQLGATIVDLPTPPKATCAGCHDGKRSFKLTGTTCRKCHVDTVGTRLAKPEPKASKR